MVVLNQDIEATTQAHFYDGRRKGRVRKLKYTLINIELHHVTIDYRVNDGPHVWLLYWNDKHA